MKIAPADVSGHYTVPGLGDRILSAFRSVGGDPDSLTVDDLAPVDEFHLGGRGATEAIAGLAEIHPGDRVLDVGCGLGGTSRYLASAFGCEVTGVDLTEEYCQVAAMLSARVGLADCTVFRQGSALALPFPDGHFDVIWTEHVQMNIADKMGFYREMRRVLRPNGQLVFHDIFAGEKETPLHFPVPWAAEPSISHLISVLNLETVLADLGFRRECWKEMTDASIAFLRSKLAAMRNGGRQPVGLHLLMGEDAEIKFANVLRNLEEGRVRVIQAVLTSYHCAPRV